ncbi:MAG: ElyC/SanA/YdcF family protein [Patescibacteria group bacterium]
MTDVFAILGYGVPKDITTDENYRTYLSIVFNHIYQESAGKEAVIIPCGGKTSCVPPFTGTEAGAMISYFRSLVKRPFVKEATKRWKFIAEDRSISSLENFVFLSEILVREKITKGRMTIFCDATRARRMKIVARRVFPKVKCTIVGIDFDVSHARYIGAEAIAKKEKVALQESLHVLSSPELLMEHHQLFEGKLRFLRARAKQGVAHPDAVAEWLKHPSKIELVESITKKKK